MFDIITVGSATVDVFLRVSGRDEHFRRHRKHCDVCYPLGLKELVTGMQLSTGGGGTNTAVAFARLGFRTGWLGVLGDDEHGSMVQRQLHEESVQLLGKKKNGMTGYSVILTSLQPDHVPLVYKGVNDRLAMQDVPFSRLQTRWFYFSAMLGQSLRTMLQLAQFAKKRHIPYAFNPSIYLAEQGMAPLRQLLEGCTVLVLNKEEAQALAGSRQHGRELLRKLHRVTGGSIVVTDGSKGAHATDGRLCYRLKPRKTHVVETTGAGDAFASGVVAGLLLKNDLAFGLRLGQAEAAAVIQHQGAKEKLLSLREAQTKIQKRQALLRIGALR